MALKLTADKLEILSRPDRILVVSGQSSLTRDAKRFQLDGKFRADRANIELAGEGGPTISNDVVIVGKSAPQAKPAQGMPLNVDVEADLGDSFKLQGKGLDARLAGAVRIRIADRRPPRVNGSIRVVDGTYAAYGQKLAIERGVINFTGAYDNPGLNILAVRRRPEGEPLSETNVEAGVEVRGTALAPADDVPDACPTPSSSNPSLPASLPVPPPPLPPNSAPAAVLSSAMSLPAVFSMPCPSTSHDNLSLSGTVGVDTSLAAGASAVPRTSTPASTLVSLSGSPSGRRRTARMFRPGLS